MRNFYIYIRERLLWDEKVAANSYVIPCNNINIAFVNTNENENVFKDSKLQTSDILSGISLPIISSPVVENNDIQSITFNIAKNHGDYMHIYEVIKKFIDSILIHNVNQNEILSLVYSDTYDMFTKTFTYLFELEVEER